MKTLIATRTTTNPAWTSVLKIRLVWNDAGYWWTADGAGNESKDAVIDANALRPGQNRKAGYSTVVAACRQATKEGWNVAMD